MYLIWYDMICLLTAIGLTHSGSSTVHICTQTVHRTTQIATNLEECGPWPVFASFTLAFALELRKKHGKPSVRVQYTYYQNTHTLQNLHTHSPTHTTHTTSHTHSPTHTPTHTHTNTAPAHTHTRQHTQSLLTHTHTHTHPRASTHYKT